MLEMDLARESYVELTRAPDQVVPDGHIPFSTDFGIQRLSELRGDRSCERRGFVCNRETRDCERSGDAARGSTRRAANRIYGSGERVHRRDSKMLGSRPRTASRYIGAKGQATSLILGMRQR